MATILGQLIWEIVKTNNCFLVKQFKRGNAKVQFSTETNNLCNLNSYKHSRLANKKTMTIQPADKEQGVVLATTKTKKQNKPKISVNKSILKKEFPRMSRAVANQVVDNYYIPDLKKFALARDSVSSAKALGLPSPVPSKETVKLNNLSLFRICFSSSKRGLMNMFY